MLEITTKHYMYFMRLLTRETLFYSEMINIGEIINKEDCLDFFPDLEPLCIQCGCPSKKVSAGNFGAVLMNDPKLVGNCVKKMNDILFSSIK